MFQGLVWQFNQIWLEVIHPAAGATKQMHPYSNSHVLHCSVDDNLVPYNGTENSLTL